MVDPGDGPGGGLGPHLNWVREKSQQGKQIKTGPSTYCSSSSGSATEEVTFSKKLLVHATMLSWLLICIVM